MYEVDDRDEVIELKTAPQSSVGAPNPIVLAGEHDVFLAYLLEDSGDGDGTSVRIVGVDTDTEGSVAVVRFWRCSAHMFGPPNDEAFAGHPLANRGLSPYGVFDEPVHPAFDHLRDGAHMAGPAGRFGALSLVVPLAKIKYRFFVTTHPTDGGHLWAERYDRNLTDIFETQDDVT